MSPIRRSSVIHRPHRRGFSTLWLILSLPVMLIMLCAVIEVGNAWQARVELETALEAAALAAVKEWKAAGVAGTATARSRAVAVGSANCVRGMSVVLDRNDGGGGANDNFSCDGDIILGNVESVMDDLIFNADEAPGLFSTTTVSLKFSIATKTDTRNDVQDNTVADPLNNIGFRIYDFSTLPASSLQIASLNVNVGTVPVAGVVDEAFFDVRNPPGSGTSTDKNNGLQPVSVVQQGTIVGRTFTPAFSDDTTSPDFQVTFTGAGTNGFDTGEEFKFGVDTDGVGTDLGTGDNRFADLGGDFGDATVTVTFKDAVTGDIVGSISGQMTSTGLHTSLLCFVNEPLPAGNFGVRTQHTKSVPMVCSNLFGSILPTFTVYAKATAMCEASGGSPRLIRISEFRCN